MKNKFIGLFCLFSVSCQQVQPNTQQDIKVQPKFNNNFNQKAIDPSIIRDAQGSYKNDDLGISYYGSWTYLTPTNVVAQEINQFQKENINDISGGFSARLSPQNLFFKTFDNANTTPNDLLQVRGSQNQQDIMLNTEPIKYLEIDGKNAMPDPDPSLNLKYNPTLNSGNGSFSQTNGFYSSNGQPIFIENNGVSGNTSTIYNLAYNSTPRLNNNLPSDWKEKNNYTYSYNKNSNITFNFYGTNVEIFANKGINTIWNDVKISLYKESSPNNFNVLVTTAIGNTSDTVNQTGSIYKFKALTMAKYMVKLESKNPAKSQGKVSYLYGFDKACVYPSIEYKFPSISDKNMIYYPALYNTAGKVEITMDNDLSTSIQKSLYSPSSESNKIYEFVDRDTNNIKHHVMTIESLGLPANNSTTNGTEISLYKMYKMSEISSTFNRKNLPLYKIKGSDYGKMDLYVNDKFVKTIDLYNSSGLVKEIEIIKNLEFSENSNTFKLVNSLDYNALTGRDKISFYTFIRENHHAKFSFKINSVGDLAYVCSRGPDRGMVKARLFDAYTNQLVSHPNNNTLIDLYIPNKLYGIDKRYHHIMSDIPTGNYYLMIEPAYDKNPASSDYLIDVSEIKFVVDGTNIGYTGVNNFDSVCTP